MAVLYYYFVLLLLERRRRWYLNTSATPLRHFFVSKLKKIDACKHSLATVSGVNCFMNYLAERETTERHAPFKCHCLFSSINKRRWSQHFNNAMRNKVLLLKAPFFRYVSRKEKERRTTGVWLLVFSFFPPFSSSLESTFLLLHNTYAATYCCCCFWGEVNSDKICKRRHG